MSKPFFKNGKLVTDDPITRAKAAEIQKAANWTAVISTNVGYVCWRIGKGKKTGFGVWFDPKDRNGKSKGQGKIYFYPTAPFEIFLGIKRAGSPGKFLNDAVIGKYASEGPYPAE